MANTKNFKVNSGIQPTAYHENVGTVSTGSTTVGYDLSSASYDSKSLYVAGSENRPITLAISANGTKLYVGGQTGDALDQYTLSTAYDISTGSYDSVTFSYSASAGTNVQGIFLKPDGTKFFLTDDQNNRVYAYTMSTAFDLSTASYDSVSFYVGSQSNANTNGVEFTSDGTKFFVIGKVGTTPTIYQYNMTTAWDISTASYSNNSLVVTSQLSTGANDIRLNGDATKLYAGSYSTNAIFQYDMTTAGDLSTASYSGTSYSTTSETTTIFNFCFGDSGVKLYVCDYSTDTVFQYSTSSTLATKTLDLSTGSVFEITPTSDIQISLSNPAASGTVSAATLLLDGAAGGSGYDLSIASDTGNSFSPTGGAADFKFGNNGYRFYHVNTNEIVYQANLTTPYDLSTATATSTFSTDPQTNDALGLEFKSDGTKMYVVCQSLDRIFQYTLSTAWDITSASYDSVYFSLGTGYWWQMLFYNSGSNFLVYRNDTAAYYTYSCSTAWDLSTASQVSYTSFSPSTPRSMAFNGDGTKFYFGDLYYGVIEYALSTAYTLSSKAAYGDRVTYGSFGTSNDIYPLAFNDDGTKFFIGSGTTKQYQSVAAAAITYDSSVKWSGATAPTSPAIGETDVLTFSTRDGGTTYTGLLAIDGAK